MHKSLLILGLLVQGPLHGYELHRIVRAHGELYTDLKKANLYYLLDRLAAEGYLTVHTESGTRGRRGERLVYALTDLGQAHFETLLREVMCTYAPVHTGVDVAVVFLAYVPPAEATILLRERRSSIAERRAHVGAELGSVATNGPLASIAADHLLSLMDAELAWIDRSLGRLQALGWENGAAEACRKEGDHGS